MASLAKQEYRPLLEGLKFHGMSLEDVSELCVRDRRFILSKSRQKIMDGLVSVVERIKHAGINGSIWIDGSFVTEKIDPEDVDILLCIKEQDVVLLTGEQKAVVEWVNGNLKTDCFCDSYVLIQYAEGSQHFEAGDFVRGYWMTKFGRSREEEPKGIAVVTL